MEASAPQRHSAWPHRLAIVLALVTFPLIWVGGLVTTYDAGMAVPDWPGTYGYNLFAYPWQTWIAGPWDLFIEHGHRLLGALAGVVAIALLLVACLADRRRWVIELSAIALALVIVQGLLGGARVLFDERLMALVHGCVGPLFFAYLAALIVMTSEWWQATGAGLTARQSGGRKFLRAAWATAGLACLQLFLGAAVRHLPLSASPGVFRAVLVLHLVVAGLLAVHVLGAPWRLWKLPADVRGLAWPTILVQLLLIVQIALGAATYVVKYSWPAWLGDYQFAASYVVQEKSLGQTITTTAHVANGSLILFVSVFAAVRSSHLFGAAPHNANPLAAKLGRAIA